MRFIDANADDPATATVFEGEYFGANMAGIDVLVSAATCYRIVAEEIARGIDDENLADFLENQVIPWSGDRYLLRDCAFTELDG
jgi:hypothetical protein